MGPGNHPTVRGFYSNPRSEKKKELMTEESVSCCETAGKIL
jgi:hypothetical protein